MPVSLILQVFDCSVCSLFLEEGIKSKGKDSAGNITFYLFCEIYSLSEKTSAMVCIGCYVCWRPIWFIFIVIQSAPTVCMFKYLMAIKTSKIFLSLLLKNWWCWWIWIRPYWEKPQPRCKSSSLFIFKWSSIEVKLFFRWSRIVTTNVPSP